MKRMFPMILLFALLLCVPVRADELTLDAPSALLMEKQTGTVLFAKDEHTPREPASVTKVMTLLLTMEAIDSGALSYDDTVTGSAHAASMGGSQIWLKEGEQMRVEDLIKAVCIVSGNDAAVTLGEHLAGSEEAFVARMNERAKELGMHDTHFLNCTGLPAVSSTSFTRGSLAAARAASRRRCSTASGVPAGAKRPDHCAYSTFVPDSFMLGTSGSATSRTSPGRSSRANTTPCATAGCVAKVASISPSSIR